MFRKNSYFEEVLTDVFYDCQVKLFWQHTYISVVNWKTILQLSERLLLFNTLKYTFKNYLLIWMKTLCEMWIFLLIRFPSTSSHLRYTLRCIRWLFFIYLPYAFEAKGRFFLNAQKQLKRLKRILKDRSYWFGSKFHLVLCTCFCLDLHSNWGFRQSHPAAESRPDG